MASAALFLGILTIFLSMILPFLGLTWIAFLFGATAAVMALIDIVGNKDNASKKSIAGLICAGVGLVILPIFMLLGGVTAAVLSFVDSIL